MIGHVLPKKTYWTIFGLLMVLLALTVLVAEINLGRTANVVIALTIAVVKATLVVLYFMHVKFSSKLVWVFASIGFLWFLILVAITMSDYASRDWLPVFGK
ncbi:MAG TPA: cytochrome C oxidase subunit IV family protein [Candidatus Kapabacteria bacterium]|jgi:cytochrome c oxidase subunit 4|nr:cytochrome C oxidase subunit IV family protein [Candidatus Kapabacteria bacterium]